MNGGMSFSASGRQGKISASAEAGFDFLGLDSQGTGRQDVNLLVAPARLVLDDPDQRVGLPDRWTVFTQIYAHDPVIGQRDLTGVPDALEVGGRELERKMGEAKDGTLDLAPLIGGTLSQVGAYVYVPFSLTQEEEIVWGFGADFWLQAWIDGEQVCTTFPQGNRTFPPTDTDVVRTATLAKGNHLLVIRFLSGASSSLLCLSAKRKLWTTRWDIRDDRWVCSMTKEGKDDRLTWDVLPKGDDLLWRVSYEGEGRIENLKLVLPFNSMITPTVLLPAKVGDGGVALGPWLMVAPDFGHLRIQSEGVGPWHAIIEGWRGNGCMTPYAPVVPPAERERISKEHVKNLGYLQQRIEVAFHLDKPLCANSHAALRLSPVELSKPDGIDDSTWRQIRRPYLNQWQPCSRWNSRRQEWMMLGNNTLSDVAFCCTFFYADPMLFWHELVPGISVAPLLRHTLDHALRCHVARDGHVNGFWNMEDMFFFSNPAFIIAAWDYWQVSRDSDWLKANVAVLHRIGEFIAQRDVDQDGLVESFNSGNAGNLHEPHRGDIWFESINFGWKNAWTNALTYRAWNGLAQMLKAAGHPGGADYYLSLAVKLREAFAEKLLSKENGWFVSWISEDGRAHDYCHTFINGMAVAYGLVPPREGRAILERVIRKSHQIGFEQWRFGIPSNLITISKEDMMQADITLDGTVNHEHWHHWPEGLTEEAAFGYRHPNGLIHPVMVRFYLLGLQTAGLDEEADRILNEMLKTAEAGLFQNGITNDGGCGPEYIMFDGRTAGYEGYLPEVWNFLIAAFTRNPDMRKKLRGCGAAEHPSIMDSTSGE